MANIGPIRDANIDKKSLFSFCHTISFIGFMNEMLVHNDVMLQFAVIRILFMWLSKLLESFTFLQYRLCLAVLSGSHIFLFRIHIELKLYFRAIIHLYRSCTKQQ